MQDRGAAAAGIDAPFQGSGFQTPLVYDSFFPSDPQFLLPHGRLTLKTAHLPLHQ